MLTDIKNTTHRVVEALALASFATLWIWLAVRFPRHGGAWMTLALLPLAWLAADFLGGLVHFVADNFGDPRTPYFGPSFIGPFRDHHTDPAGITRHGFLERHGNNSMVSLPVLGATLYWPYSPWLDMFVLGTTLGVAITNQIHCWAHMERPPRWVAFLQTCRVILPRDHHGAHHTPPYKTNYCILSGWTSGTLNLVVRWLLRRPDLAVPPQPKTG